MINNYYNKFVVFDNFGKLIGIFPGLKNKDLKIRLISWAFVQPQSSLEIKRAITFREL